MANIQVDVEIPPIKLVPAGSSSSSHDSSSTDWTKAIKTVVGAGVAVVVLILLFLFVKSLLPIATSQLGLDPKKDGVSQDKDCNKPKTKTRSYNPVGYVEPVTQAPQDNNSLKDANNYTDEQVGKLRQETKEGFDGVNKRIDGVETTMNNGFNDIKGMLKEKNKPPKTDCPPETDDDDPTN